jgi:tetratricopeptide (TPR) repeat protein
MVVLAATVVLLGGGLGLKEALHWKRNDKKPAPHVPMVAQVSQQQQQQAPADPELDALRSDLERAPQDMNALRSVASLLADRLRNRPDAPPALVFEAIDVLSRILKIAPDDPDALLMMADVSFDQKAFTKAIEFYERYLKIEPNDLGATARYASTLTFLQRYDDSIKQLDKVLAKDPKSFPAMAYLAITYAQKGDIAKAKDLGVKALELAPSEEARARFSGFVESISDPSATRKAQDSTPSQINTTAPPSIGGVAGFVAALRANPIAGPKLVSHDDSEPGLLKLVFKDFPMAMMPPFAKEKFFSSIKASAMQTNLVSVKKIIFIDQATGQQMESIDLN